MSRDPIYFIELSDGRFDGERNWSRRDATDAVISREFGNVRRMFECFEDEHRLEDITEEIAREIAIQYHIDREPVSWELQNFIENALGVLSTRGLNLAA